MQIWLFCPVNLSHVNLILRPTIQKLEGWRKISSHQLAPNIWPLNWLDAAHFGVSAAERLWYISPKKLMERKISYHVSLPDLCLQVLLQVNMVRIVFLSF